MKRLDGKVALVTGGGRGIGRSIALALAARGVRVVVMGPEERPIGETVGEIAYGGGKARHVVGDVREPADLARAVARAVEVFGGLDIVIANARAAQGDDFASPTFQATAPGLRDNGRLVAIGEAAAAPKLRDLVDTVAKDLSERKITCNAVVVCSGSGAGAIEPEDVAERVVALCSEAGDVVTGQSMTIG